MGHTQDRAALAESWIIKYLLSPVNLSISLPFTLSFFLCYINFSDDNGVTGTRTGDNPKASSEMTCACSIREERS